MSELVVFSHLRWIFVWQRPQHVISRLAARRRTWFVEEPLVADVAEPVLRTDDAGQVTRVWLEVPGPERHVGFSADEAASYRAELVRLLGAPAGERIAWLYTPMAANLARAVRHDLLVYDVMDDLASFKDAPPGLSFAHRETLRAADVVFTGGRSLCALTRRERPDAHLLASGVEPDHYAVRRPERPAGSRPVAGYVGVIDERIDLELVAELAHALPDWEIRMVGPVAKIDPSLLPTRENVAYLGARPYEQLPAVMAGFDVALMPFALDDSTRSISPTKTLEYLAAGLPVVSTRVPDVVADFERVVQLADDGAAFAQACRAALRSDGAARRRHVEPLLRLRHWDTIAARMEELMDEARGGARAVAGHSGTPGAS